MVTMTEQCLDDKRSLLCEDDAVRKKTKSFGLSTSEYSVISIETRGPDLMKSKNKKSSTQPGFLEPGCILEPQCVGVAHMTDTNNNVKSAPLRRRHSSVASLGDPATRRLSRTPSVDALRNPESLNQKPPRHNGYMRNNSDKKSSRPPSGKRTSRQSPHSGNTASGDEDTSNASRKRLDSDSVDDVSIVNENVTDESAPTEFQCNEKKHKDTTATKQLIKSSIQAWNKNETECNHAHCSSLLLCRWCESRPTTSNHKSSASSTHKKKTSLVFSRLVRDSRENAYQFTHCKDSSDYMYYYRIHHTVGKVGDLAKAHPVMGRDVPDPYLTRPSNVCSLDIKLLRFKRTASDSLITEVKSVPSAPISIASSCFSSNRKTDEQHKRSCPNLSPVRQLISPVIQDFGKIHTPNQHCVPNQLANQQGSTNQQVISNKMDPYVPLSTLPHICNNPDLTPPKEVKTSISDSVSTSSQFDGEIVGMKHKLPTSTACTLSAICKPFAGVDVYGEYKSGPNSYRSQHGCQQKTFKNELEMSQTQNYDHPGLVMHQHSGHSHKKVHSDKGCHGCTRITSLIREQRKTTKDQISKSRGCKQESFGQCKPLDEQSVNILRRLQKMSIG